jgi:ssDNA-binding Zn-finger/Zn-ribbon topoisomerase 1
MEVMAQDGAFGRWSTDRLGTFRGVAMAVQRRHDMGPGGRCVCPKCEETAPHAKSVRCQDMRCPKCGAKMLREGSYHHALFLKKKAQKARSP